MSSSSTPHSPVATVIETFNLQLAHAKLGALKILQDLTASLTDPDAPVGQALRELRLTAVAILRTAPLKHPPARTDEPDAPSPTAPPEPAPPTYRPELNPTCRAARADVRMLLRRGQPDLIRLTESARRTSTTPLPLPSLERPASVSPPANRKSAANPVSDLHPHPV